MQVGTKSGKWMICGLVSIGMAVLITLLVSRRGLITGGISFETNNASGRQAVVLAITNHSSKSLSLTVFMARMKDGGFERDVWFVPQPIPLNGKGSLSLDMQLPPEEVRMPSDAIRVPWRVTVHWQREVTGFESVIAEGVEKIGFRYPFRGASHQAFDGVGP